MRHPRGRGPSCEERRNLLKKIYLSATCVMGSVGFSTNKSPKLLDVTAVISKYTLIIWQLLTSGWRGALNLSLFPSSFPLFLSLFWCKLLGHPQLLIANSGTEEDGRHPEMNNSSSFLRRCAASQVNRSNLPSCCPKHRERISAGNS